MSVVLQDRDTNVRSARRESRAVFPPDEAPLFLVALAAPALIYVLAIAVGPMIQGFLYSFESYNLIRPATRRFVGLDNYFAFLTTIRRAAR